MIDILSIYHALPYPLRIAAASVRGFQLRWWRYGAKSEELIDEILERDTWNTERWKIWQEERLSFILHRAATQVPYYHDYWNHRRRNGDRSSWEVLANWPILEKENVRQNPMAFLAEDCNANLMFEDHTGGTTGTPLNIYESRKTVQLWYAMCEARIRRWHHVSIKDKWIILGGQLIAPLGQENPPFWVENVALNQLYLSTFHISKQTVKHYVDIINKVNPTHWMVYPSSAAYLAQFILDLKLEVHSPKVIFTNAEPLWENQRKIISDVFGCPVRNTYGMGEFALGASECHEGSMHYWPDSGILEVVEKDENGTGQMLVTGLINQDMPLIRYKLGDRGKLPYPGNCNCRRNLPCIDNIEGRDSDMILTPDGRKIFWLNPIFYGLPLQEAQIIQEALDQIRVKVVPSYGFNVQMEHEIIHRVQQRLGDSVKVLVEPVDKIPRTKAGKFQAVISKIANPNER